MKYNREVVAAPAAHPGQVRPSKAPPRYTEFWKRPMNASPEELELARLIVESLNLEGVAAQDIDPEARLFGAGLGLDSLDMLELAMAIERAYGVKLRSDDPDNQRIFASLRSLNSHIRQRRAG